MVFKPLLRRSAKKWIITILSILLLIWMSRCMPVIKLLKHNKIFWTNNNDAEVNFALTTHGYHNVNLKYTNTVPPCSNEISEYNVTVNYTFPNWKEVNDELSDLSITPGGSWSPEDCQSNYSSAIIIPYKDRDDNLRRFLVHIHPFLHQQWIHYQIFIVEQLQGQPFNRAKMLNIGYVEAKKLGTFDCYIFHDVDMLPINSKNLYHCDNSHPKHFGSSIQKFWWKVPYGVYFGGVCGLTEKQMQKINGFSNLFWGWGGEDDEMFYRIRESGQLPIIRYATGGALGLYATLPHGTHGDRTNRGLGMKFRDSVKANLTYRNLKNYVKENMNTDGLSSLQYEVRQLKFEQFYTWILVDIYPPVIL